MPRFAADGGSVVKPGLCLSALRRAREEAVAWQSQLNGKSPVEFRMCVIYSDAILARVAVFLQSQPVFKFRSAFLLTLRISRLQVNDRLLRFALKKMTKSQ